MSFFFIYMVYFLYYIIYTKRNLQWKVPFCESSVATQSIIQQANVTHYYAIEIYNTGHAQ